MSESGAMPTDAGDARRTEIPLRQAAYESIENLLKNGELRPGQIVSQRELVKRTGLTLGAVREAVPRLEAEGLLQTVPQRGLMVPSLDIAFVRDAYQLRRVLEMSAIPAAVERMSDAAIEELIGWHRDLRARMEKGGSAEAALAADALQSRDWSMHEGFIAMTGNRLMINIFRVTAIKIRMVVQSRIQVTSYNARRVIDEHLAFLEPLARRDAEAMAAGLSRHIDNSLAIALGGSI
ncbi:MAG: GntR family transcriptional regulator [Mesorhizobium sp.]|nr:GntR family transcriptional regulator [Mesorhizobium sp.]MCO5162973.1 GntR family transcriptional regulator [Mesorhizobium sp.]